MNQFPVFAVLFLWLIADDGFNRTIEKLKEDLGFGPLRRPAMAGLEKAL